ncbi:Retrovirus-related Pol polyprotein from transposon 17.6 [Operophtera brumata]|uniref:RNA-directed DNA polymerase n=1 Tax=Operophtera brumata TaxID=104452 RepID=A0A0L7KSA4_OPEBR|nr:Retrovirus-related Pol polyprotein from transposon 17.6 [Operophtera brumata]
MPRRKRNGLDDGSEDDADAETQRDRTVKSSSPNIAMTEDMLQTLVSTITRSQAESNRVLIESILAGNRDQLPSTPSPRPDTQGHSLRSGNFSKCTTRFDGSSKNADELEAFIDSIEVYRDCTNVSDEHALRGLPMLLTGEAAVWWQGVKSSVTSWTDALQRLRGMYGVPRPAYKIFRDIFATEQSSERADVFISKVRALLAKLPYIVPEVMKLDIVYGLLDRRIRKRVSRDAVDGLEQLITKVRLVEESLAEVSSSHLSNNNVSSVINPFAAARDRSNTNLSVNPANAVGDPLSIAKPTVTSSTDLRTPSAKRSDSEGQLKRVRPKCIYCKLFGHTVDNCRNKEKKDSSKVDDSANRSSNSTQLRCYGCGQLGVIRSKCENCKSAPTTSKSDFCSAYVYDRDESRPLVEVQVVNRTGVAILDTGATHSIAGPMLYDPCVHHHPESSRIKPSPDRAYWLVTEISYQAHHHRDPSRKDTHCDRVTSQSVQRASTGRRRTRTAFIDSIEVYRDCTNVSDEHALRGLPMLLTGEAAVWWQGVKSSVTSWTDGLQQLRGMYGVPHPAYTIFRDIFATEQSSERADVFISKVRALLAKLPYIVPEVMKLDIVYGLLDRRIRKRVSRDAVDGLEQLITKVRLVEESLAEVSSSHLSNNNVSSVINPFAAARDRSNTNLSVNPANAVGDPLSIAKPTVTSSTDLRTPSAKRSDSEGQLKRVRPKCIYCKLFGHTVDNCRNKEKKDSSKVDDSANRSSNSTQLRCYGCGQLGVIRSKCENCKSAPTTSKSDFCSAYVYDRDESRPLVEVQVVNRTGVAILDTGATHSIAGPMLYGLLVDAGVEFRKTSRTIGLADGSQQVCAALECDTDVTLEGHVIPTTFLVLPNAPTRTLLGRDFIMKALILLDLPQSSWCFNDEPRCWYPFITSFDLPTTGEMELMKVEASNLVLRDEEGAKLTADQRTELNALLDPDVRKIVEDLESTDDPFRGRSWSNRGFTLSDGILYRYGPEECEEETACLVVPEHEREKVLVEYHNTPTAGHFGVERTLDRLKTTYYWPGMRHTIIAYLKKCIDCQRYKADNRKPAGLLQTPATNRRFEVVAIDLFGPLPETASKNKWILILEDTCSRWVELFALQNATSVDCAKVLIAEVFLRYGVPRRVLSDNGVQFVSEVMQQACHSLGITQSLSPVYHPQANPVE